MSAVRIYRGDTWMRTWVIESPTGSPIDLSGCTARLHVRDAGGAKVMEASTADGRITIQTSSGRIDLVMPPTLTNVAPGSYRFDIEVTYPSGVRQTYEQAALVVLEDMTHD